MNKEYKHCPVCGTLCTIGGDDKEGTHYYMPIASTCSEDVSKNAAEIDRLSWLSSGDDEPTRTCHAKLSGLTFVVEENTAGASLRIVLDRESYPNIYDAERGAQSILNEITKGMRAEIERLKKALHECEIDHQHWEACKADMDELRRKGGER